MTSTQDLLVEIGTEELPPKALLRLRDAFHDAVCKLLSENHLAHGASHAYASPRRLALLVRDVPLTQPDREVIKRGPALKAAFDEDGNPTKPAEGFARSCGVSVSELEQLKTDKGLCLGLRLTETGQAAADVIPGLIEQALKAMPAAKRMRWGSSITEFVRPLHWILLLHGNQPIKATILGIESDRYSRGHRFHHNERIAIAKPGAYVETLETTGHVVVDMDRRRDSIRAQVIEAAEAIGGKARIDAALLDEVTALVEWPVAITGGFDRRFLDVPAEALVSSMQDHQKYFPVMDGNDQLLPNFITIANIASRDPDQVQAGNERVIRARLDDAAFFWEQDRKHSLQSLADRLDNVTFQQGLGSLGDKQRRIAVTAAAIAKSLGQDSAHVMRAAALCKCDLLTSMVQEFPELQGIMGCYYATHDGEDAAVAAAMDEQYQPRFSGDQLPTGITGKALAIADRLDTLAGIFALGKPPTGDKDPFGLRRAALGVLRIMIEKKLDLDLGALIDTSTAAFPAEIKAGKIAADLFAFMMERLRAYYLEGDYDSNEFEAVLARQPQRPLDFDQRMRAVHAFRKLPESANLAAANKRIRNILRKATMPVADTYKVELLQEPAEQALAAAIAAIETRAGALFEMRDYTGALSELAALQAPVDAFFDDVMVMADDPALRDNRLALLNVLSQLFLRVADISKLQA
ncbi:MAG: glycine--tRNA ligase subunit beta [Gammaproteobacteria bacterium]